MKKRSGVSFAFILVLMIVCLVIAAYLVWNVGLHHQGGSMTPYADVYSFQVENAPGWRYVLRNDNGILYRSGLCLEPVYIYEENGTLIVLDAPGSESAECYDLATGEAWTQQEFVWRNPFAKTKNIITKPIYAGNSRHAQAWDISAEDGGFWCWLVNDTQGEPIWDGTSETPPEFEGDDTFLTVYYTEEGQEYCYEFSPEEGWRSYDYALFEDRTVYVEQLTDLFTLYNVELPENVRTTGFTNTEPVELTDCNSAYLRAKAEVKIPYDLVTFRFEVHGYDIAYWEVTFSQKNDPDGAAQTIYMDNSGVTLYVLDGRGTDL